VEIEAGDKVATYPMTRGWGGKRTITETIFPKRIPDHNPSGETEYNPRKKRVFILSFSQE